MTGAARTHVLICTDQLAVGGAERVAVDIANTLDRTTTRVSFCATRVAGPLADRLADDVELLVLGRRATWDVAKVAQFARWAKDNRVDVVHSHGRGTMQFVELARRAGGLSARHVFHDHYNWLHRDRSAPASLKLPLRTVDAYLGVDSRLCEWAVTAAEVDPDRVHLVRSGVDLSRFADVAPVDVRAALGAADDAVVFAMVGNLRAEKDHPALVRALERLSPAARERVAVAVVGDTEADPRYYADLREMVEARGITPQLRFLGRRDDAPGVMAGSDVGIVTSKNETGPLVVLEYMASGLPFVTTDTGEISRAVSDRGVGWVVPPRDAPALQGALEGVLALTPEERRSLGVAARRLAEAEFSQAEVTRRIEAVYRLVRGDSAALPLSG